MLELLEAYAHVTTSQPYLIAGGLLIAACLLLNAVVLVRLLRRDRIKIEVELQQGVKWGRHHNPPHNPPPRRLR